MNLKINQKEYYNKVLGCWIGKNIGGTIGTPFEGTHDILNLDGFTSKKGEPLPNDDLDLQLVWLNALEDVGPKILSANILSDYWLSYIAPHFNEYGIGKANLEMGLLPPACGQFNNDWKDSNGAWIRSEVWACLAPGIPNIAVKYAIMDASIDHGLSEGTYAEIFTAALQSMAFFENDIRKLVEKSLEFIPENCRVAKSIKMVLDGYDNNIHWTDVRNKIVADSEDLGWFQAPANVAFTVLGLIYGEGDFKKSVILAVNCGDDTDCTAGTAGALLGIIYGADKIPDDWKEYVGDRIITYCINASYMDKMPQTCTAFTDRIIKQMPIVMNAYNIGIEYTDEMSSIGDVDADSVLKDYAKRVFERSPYSFEITDIHTHSVVEYQKQPKIKPGEEFDITITFENIRCNPFYYEIYPYLPEGWSADYDRVCYISNKTVNMHTNGIAKWKIKLIAGEKVEAINRIPLMVCPKNHMPATFIPIVLLG